MNNITERAYLIDELLNMDFLKKIKETNPNKILFLCFREEGKIEKFLSGPFELESKEKEEIMEELKISGKSNIDFCFDGKIINLQLIKDASKIPTDKDVYLESVCAYFTQN